MQRIQNFQVIARTTAILAMLIPTGISGCAPLHHLVDHPASQMLANKHRTYYHSPHSGRVIPKDGCFTYCEPGCFGYEPTCWQPWPAECPNCPVQEEVIISEQVIGGGVIHEATQGIPVAEPVVTQPHAQPAQPLPPRPANRRVASAPRTQQPLAVSPTKLVSQPAPRHRFTPPALTQKLLLGSSVEADMPTLPAEHEPTIDDSETVTLAQDFGPQPDIFEQPFSSRRRASRPDIAKADEVGFDVAAEPISQPEQPAENLAVQADERELDSFVTQPSISNADADVAMTESVETQEIISPTAPLDDAIVIVSQPETTHNGVTNDTSTQLDEAADVHFVTESVRDADPIDVGMTDRLTKTSEGTAGQARPKVAEPELPRADIEVTGKAKNRLPLRVPTVTKPMIRFAHKTERTVVKIDSTSSSKSAVSLRFRD